MKIEGLTNSPIASKMPLRMTAVKDAASGEKPYRMVLKNQERASGGPRRAKGSYMHESTPRNLAFVALALVTAMIFTGIAGSCSGPGSADAYSPDISSEVLKLAAFDESDLDSHIDDKAKTDSIAAFYHDPRTRDDVVRFFTGMTSSRAIALAILDNATSQKVPVGLAFALAYEESEFNPKAVGRNADSVDSGLFQLNSKTFPELAGDKAFDPRLNAQEGLKYLREALEHAGNEVAALAMYNAGRTRVARGSTPRKTLDYISRVLMYEKNIYTLFGAKVVARSSLLQQIRFGLLSGASSRSASPR